ncbi:MAG: acetylxylan esterase [Bacteroidales bacterium]|nr:acetylxylan esterase [Bacteroidales bacterium]
MKKYLTISLGAWLFSAGLLYAQVSAPGRAYLDYTVLPAHGDGVCALGETATVKVVATAGGRGLDGTVIRFEAGPDALPADTAGDAVFREGEAVVSFGTMREPGFRYCRLSFQVEGQTIRDNVKLAFAPDMIEPTIACPPDFDKYWRRTLDKASKVPMTIEETPWPQAGDDQVETRMVKIQSYEKGCYLYGWLSRPRDGKRHPVLLIPPGAGVKRINPLPDYAREGFITLAIDVHALPVDAPDSIIRLRQTEVGEFTQVGISHRDSYYYRRIYCSLVRAIDYLCSLPDFDGQNVGVTGGSQGGALSIVAAGLDPRITFVAAFYPALCDVSGFLYGRAGGWPRFYSKSPVPPEQSAVEMKTLSYYDVVNFARRIKVPGFYSYGHNDGTCPPTSVCAALNQIKAPKILEVTPSSAHWRFTETLHRSIEWMKGQCR